jgi:hypothetical protein
MGKPVGSHGRRNDQFALVLHPGYARQLGQAIAIWGCGSGWDSDPQSRVEDSE